jgi:hypothetical protein
MDVTKLMRATEKMMPRRRAMINFNGGSATQMS